MEKDKQLKEILLFGAEGASPDFAQAVMQIVNGLQETPFVYQPLVSPRLRRILVIAFGTLAAVILVLCLMMALAKIPIAGWIQNIVLPDLNYGMILMFIITFWIVFAIKSIFDLRRHFIN